MAARHEHVTEHAGIAHLEAAVDRPDAVDPTLDDRAVPPRSLAQLVDVLEELRHRRVVAAAHALHERPRVAAPERRAHGEPRERGGQAVPVALGAHPPLPDRLRAPPPGGRRVASARVEDRDVLDPRVTQRGMRDEPGQPAADDRHLPRGHRAT